MTTRNEISLHSHNCGTLPTFSIGFTCWTLKKGRKMIQLGAKPRLLTSDSINSLIEWWIQSVKKIWSTKFVHELLPDDWREELQCIRVEQLALKPLRSWRIFPLQHNMWRARNSSRRCRKCYSLHEIPLSSRSLKTQLEGNLKQLDGCFFVSRALRSPRPKAQINWTDCQIDSPEDDVLEKMMSAK